MGHGGPFVVNTGKWSARAAQEKYVVREHSTEDKIWWGEYNRPYDPQLFSALHGRIQAFLQDEELFVQDCYVGADPNYRMPVRIITEYAWHSLFARNLLHPAQDPGRVPEPRPRIHRDRGAVIPLRPDGSTAPAHRPPSFSTSRSGWR